MIWLLSAVSVEEANWILVSHVCNWMLGSYVCNWMLGPLEVLQLNRQN
jgi:hypothetical protein